MRHNPVGVTLHRLVAIENMEGLSQCLACGAAEGELPTECPGRPMTEEEKSSVYDGTLDYKGGAWFVSERP